MILVELIDEDTGECLAMPEWVAVPNVGERFSNGGEDYLVVDRGWGVCCKGDGSPLWGEQCITITLQKI